MAWVSSLTNSYMRSVEITCGCLLPPEDTNRMSPRTLLCLCLAFALAACGGGSDSPTAPAGPMPGMALKATVAASPLPVTAFSGPRGNYEIARSGVTYTVTDRTGADATRSFDQPTVLRFADISVAINAADTNAGRLYRLYKVFDRAPGPAELGGWLEAMDQGVRLGDVAGGFVGSAEFSQRYGENPSSRTLVTLLYRNVLNREPDPDGLQGWVDYYDAGRISKTDLVLSFTESEENRARLLPRIENGIEFIAGGGANLPSPAPARRTLVLYDAPTGTQYEKLGLAYAIMLRNLLGHFEADVELLPVHQYTAGKVEGYDATFYLGSYYDHQPPAAFLADATTTKRRLVWFRYNLWHAAWDPALDFTASRGISFAGLRGMNAAPSAADPAPGFFDTIRYKGKDFVKYYQFNGATGAVDADPDAGIVAIADPAKAQTLVTMTNPRTGEAAPYVVRSGNFWYVADLPFSYIGPRDRYLVLADLLHDMLGVEHEERHLALVRLEDVGATVDVQTMKRLSDFLASRAVPFSIATIPLYKDPLGTYNDGTPLTVPFAEATGLRTALDYAKARGAEIVMHGYTHQYGARKNPHTGVSGDDYEFWDITADAPVPEDSYDWAHGRISAGLNDLRQGGYDVVAWEAPHYHASPLSARAAAALFRNTYQRVVYFTSDKPDYRAGAGRDFGAGQLFPYVVARDHYGQRVIPENLGNIEYDIRDIDPTSNYNYTSKDILLNAQYALAVRDGYASFFFHPFWLEAGLGTPGFEDFRATVDGITSLGFTWVPPSRAR